MKALAIAALALFTAAVFFTSSSCTTECVDFADCVKDKADAGKTADGGTPPKQEFTCDKGVCKPGSPFPPYDAGM